MKAFILCPGRHRAGAMLHESGYNSYGRHKFLWISSRRTMDSQNSEHGVREPVQQIASKPSNHYIFTPRNPKSSPVLPSPNPKLPTNAVLKEIVLEIYHKPTDLKSGT